MFSQAPPVWLGADRKLSPTHNPWTSTALLSSAPCLGFPAVPPAAGSYGAEQPRSLQTQPPAIGKIDAGCASSSDQKTSMRIWVSDRYSQPALLHLKVEEKKKGEGKESSYGKCRTVFFSTGLHLEAVWFNSSRLQGTGGTHRTYRLRTS